MTRWAFMWPARVLGRLAAWADEHPFLAALALAAELVPLALFG